MLKRHDINLQFIYSLIYFKLQVWLKANSNIIAVWQSTVNIFVSKLSCHWSVMVPREPLSGP